MEKIKGYADYKYASFESVVDRDPYAIMLKKYGKDYESYRQKWKDAGSKRDCGDFPLHIDIELQDSCNLACKICHQSYRKRSHAITDFNLIKKIIDEGSANGLRSVNFGGSGEPLLQKEILFKGIAYAAKKGIFDRFLHTNAVLLDKETSARLIESGLTHLCVSIDAATPETFKKVRGVDLYDKIVGNLIEFIRMKEELKSEIPIVRVSFVVTQLNYAEKSRFVEFWKGKANLVEFQDYLDYEKNLDIDKSLFKKEDMDCANPWKRLMVWPEGDVSLCCQFRSDDVLIGNIKSQTIKEIWAGERMRSIRGSFMSKKGLPPSCAKCMSSLYKLR